MLIAVCLCLVYLGYLPGWIVALAILRDLLILGGVLLSNVLDLELKVEPILISKFNTVLQILMVAFALGQPAVGLGLPQVVSALIYLVTFTTIVSERFTWRVGWERGHRAAARRLQEKRANDNDPAELSWIAAFAVFICAVLLFESILLPFLVGLAVAYFLDPVCDRLEQMGCSRTIATSLVTAGFFLLVILLFAILVPVLYKQLVQFAAQLPDLAARIEAKARPLLDSFANLKANNQAGIEEFLKDSLAGTAKLLGKVGSKVVGGLGALANATALLIVTPVVAFYLLRDWDLIVRKVDGWLPVRIKKQSASNAV